MFQTHSFNKMLQNSQIKQNNEKITQFSKTQATTSLS